MGGLAQGPLIAYPDADWTQRTDDELALEYEVGDSQQRLGLLRKCKAVHAYKGRHVQAWGKSWADNALETFGASRRTLEGMSGFWAAIIGRTGESFIEQLGPIAESRSLVQYIGRQAPDSAAQMLEAAVHHLAVYAEAPTVKQLASGNAGRVSARRYRPTEILAAYRDWPERHRYRNTMPKGVTALVEWMAG